VKRVGVYVVIVVVVAAVEFGAMTLRIAPTYSAQDVLGVVLGLVCLVGVWAFLGRGDPKSYWRHPVSSDLERKSR